MRWHKEHIPLERNDGRSTQVNEVHYRDLDVLHRLNLIIGFKSCTFLIWLFGIFSKLLCLILSSSRIAENAQVCSKQDLRFLIPAIGSVDEA